MAPRLYPNATVAEYGSIHGKDAMMKDHHPYQMVGFARPLPSLEERGQLGDAQNRVKQGQVAEIRNWEIARTVEEDPWRR